MRLSERVAARYFNALRGVLRQESPADKKTRPEWVDPAKGFYFSYKDGKILIRDAVSGFGKDEEAEARAFGVPSWPMDGMVDFGGATVTILKEPVDTKERARTVNDPSFFQRMMRDLMRADSRIKPNWKIKGLHRIFGKTIADLLKQEELLSTETVHERLPSYGFHGTSTLRLPEILKKGLVPGQFGESYVDLIPGFSIHMIYLATDPRTAEFYAKRQSKKDYGVSDSGVVLKIKIPDKDRIFSSETGLGARSRLWDIPVSKSIQVSGEFAYMGRIPASMIEVYHAPKGWQQWVKNVPLRPKPKIEGDTSVSIDIQLMQLPELQTLRQEYTRKWLREDFGAIGVTEGKVARVYAMGEVLGRPLRSGELLLPIEKLSRSALANKVWRFVIDGSFLPDNLAIPEVAPLLEWLQGYAWDDPPGTTRKASLKKGRVSTEVVS